jgi:hypothetical protein
MHVGRVWVSFGSALLGAVVGGLIVGSMGSAGAATGDPVLAGMANQANSTTVLKGGSSAIPLRLVSGRGVAPLQVTSAKRVVRLNSDRVDNYHANGLARVAFCAEDDAPDGVDYSCSMPFTAPTNGYLIMSGSADTRIRSRRCRSSRVGEGFRSPDAGQSGERLCDGCGCGGRCRCPYGGVPGGQRRPHNQSA